MKKSIWWLVGVVVVVVIIVVVSNQGSKETGPIKIGFIGALSGNTAIYGESVRNGVQIAVEEINNDNGINGRQIQLIQEDVACSDGKAAASAAQKLISIDKVNIIIGLPCSGEVLAVAPISESTKTIIFAQGSSPAITDAGQYIFRTWPSDVFAGKTMALRVFADGFKKAAVITENTEYATSIRDVFVREYSAIGGVVSASETFKSDVKDFRSIIAKVKQSNPDTLLINAQAGGNAAAIAKQARELGIKTQFYGYFFTGPDFVKTGSAVEGTLLLDVPTLNPNNPVSAAFLTKYEAKYNQKPSYPFYSGGGYDQMMLLAQSIREVGMDTDKIRVRLEQISDYDGVIGKFGFDKQGDVVGVDLSWGKIIDGEFKPI